MLNHPSTRRAPRFLTGPFARPVARGGAAVALALPLLLALPLAAQGTRRPAPIPPGAVTSQGTALLPVPAALRLGAGRLALDSTTSFAITGHRDPRLERALDRFRLRLARRIAQPVSRSITRTATPRSIALDVRGPGMRVQGVDEDERYTLTVGGDGATLQAATTVGALRGLETLLQLVESDGTGFGIPALAIADEPRFPWRGLLLDVSRHFMPIEQVKKTLDGMAMVKLNVLHWHLSDDQGFRVESTRFPKLHELGSDGLYYTQDEVRDVVAYARDRGIRVVPEFDIPGHTTAWFVGYPQYSAQRPPIAIRREWGGADAIFDPTKEATYTFLARFLDEMVTLFPDAYWHIGGDEVEGKHWDSNPAIVAWRTRHGFRDNDALQAHFNKRLTTILARHGKRMMGWDEILHPDLPRRTVVQSWRGTQYLANSAKQGYTGILSAPWYLDHIKPASEYYAADPVPQFDELTPAQQALILGGEACMWAEYITAETADSRIWPRLGAIAERLWSPRAVTDVADLYRRLDRLTDRLEAAGFRVRSHPARLLATIAPGFDTAPVESLLVALQPPAFGQTTNGAMLNQHHPLTRLVDAARPDPAGRWITERLVRRLALDAGDAAARDSLLVLFERWSLLLPRIEALGARSPTLAQGVPAARALARSAVVGTEALGFLAAGRKAPADWARQVQEELRGYEVPREALRVVIVGEVRKLVSLVAP
ncbi:MAG TPA: family 20 glycosylhydrolase [Gemmatimonadaceae bacterium]|nr:family 20 glycosylhydrolase [Gemmatimonadaceae bacterium]